MTRGPRAAQERRSAAPLAPAAPPDGIVGEYLATYDGKGALLVEASLRVPAPSLEVEDGADAFLFDLEAAPPGEEQWVRPSREGHTFVFAPCRAAPCRLRYRAAIREAGRKLDELETASEEGEVVIAPPSGWLLTPPRESPHQLVRFRVKTEAGTRFATGVYRSPSTEGAWDIRLADLWTAPYSAFGPLRLRTTTPKGARVDLAFGPGPLALSDDEVVAWTEQCERAVSGYFGEFPMREALLIVIAGRGHMLGEGKTLGGGGGAIFLRVGERATRAELASDWVLTHEMIHLGFPTLPREQHWAEEGLATYVEPFARARIGTLSADEAWRGLVEGVPQGLPQRGDQGLDRTPTWGRTYWGGALFYLFADIEYRRRTSGAKGLEHALRGIVAAGGNDAVRWSIEETFAVGDRAVGAPVLTELYAAWRDRPVTPDLARLWKELGVVHSGGKVTFDERAPEAAIRRAITTPD